MKVLMVGDIVGELGRQTLKSYLPELKKKYLPDFIIVNGENAAANGRGINTKIVRELLDLGVNSITLGNHAWGQSEVFDFIDRESAIIRPANFPKGTPGKGFVTFSTPQGKITVINLMGRTFMNPVLECPFLTIDKVLEQIPASTVTIVGFHGEATSEKIALGWYLDGKVSAVIGTHTHVQTADERILPKGTGYLTDVGMVGAYDGVIGKERHAVIKKFITQLPVRSEVAKGEYQLNAVMIELDNNQKTVRKLQRIRINKDHHFFQ